MLQELIDAVNAYCLEHSTCEASGHKSAKLNDTYVRMLQACDAAQQSVQAAEIDHDDLAPEDHADDEASYD